MMRKVYCRCATAHSRAASDYPKLQKTDRPAALPLYCTEGIPEWVCFVLSVLTRRFADK